MSICKKAEDAVENADVVYADSWMSYGIEKEKMHDRVGKLMPFQVTGKLMKLAKPDAIFMNCLPAMRVIKIKKKKEKRKKKKKEKRKKEKGKRKKEKGEKTISNKTTNRAKNRQQKLSMDQQVLSLIKLKTDYTFKKHFSSTCPYKLQKKIKKGKT